MSLSLATTKVAQYTAALESLAGQVAIAEGAHIKAVTDKDDGAVKESVAHLQRLKTLMGMYKDFIEFWKDIIKTVLGLLKMFTELAQGSR